MPAFNKILIANRGEIACRVIHTAQALGYRTVAVYSSSDADSRHVELADEAVCIGPAQVSQSYLKIDAIISAAQQTGADAIHPGYGFLSENAAFAEACKAADIVFIGPSVESIHLMGSKRLSKIAMLEAGVPCIPGYEGAAQDDATLAREAEAIGYPLMIKASAGGGGRGMRLVESAAQLGEQLRTARSEALNAFGSDELILEKAVIRPRHVEVQVFGDQHGNLVYLGERDCSVQRRHQKVVEEAPCPVMTETLRNAMGAAAIKAAGWVDYVGAGTVEFLLDSSSGEFYFLEMNTRLQVEHPVTELITGQDLVAWQIMVAEGQALPLQQEQIQLNGHAMEVRLYAEDSTHNFMPQTGAVLQWSPELLDGIRIDHGLREGQQISAFYDPMLAKIIAYGATREEARRKLVRAVEQCVLLGVNANQRFLANLLKHPEFAAGNATTAFIAEHFQQDPSLSPAAPGNAEIALAGALLFQAGAQQPGGANGLSGWRNVASSPLQLKLQVLEQSVALQVAVKQAGNQAQLAVTVNDQQLEIQLLELHQGRATVVIDGVRKRVAFHLQGGSLWLYGHSGNLHFTDVTHAQVTAAASATTGTVKAPMDGAIVDVQVEMGSRVSKGQLLLVLEAMKMEHPLKASVDGIISSVQVRQGDQVRNRQVLIEIEPEHADAEAVTG
ncbi:acetyl/propionyl/methylcrotonyl-CoA carboxylase subunit alpha [Pseudomonas sp. MS19]|uniref:acetyl/propionyl/methylcrotonyl-CoA carboxylase subunit alpha n=1 Tax=Pseudomonas sp. MS19 TaxID=2579939 RepID=UPI001562E5D1|nr:acetyl/propionyl/methylcrotonyl-CoA carboxylase subunit alpha [Pseudomonas sp. MS19]NRH26992.1 acetyl/propionyl/methylcrotonyl-CoA carboxylase subunit alpha [Pseudomonas sp. MS19]